MFLSAKWRVNIIFISIQITVKKRQQDLSFWKQEYKFAIKVLNGEQTVGHLPREYSRIALYFLARRGSITLEVTGDTVNNFVGEWKFHAV